MGRNLEVALPPHVHKVKARGKYYYYYAPHRFTDKAAKPQRIFGEPSDPDWWAQYHSLSSTPAPKINENSFNVLISAWQQSPEWRNMASSTQTEWTRHCRRISEVWGGLEVRGIEPMHVLALRDKFADKPANANNLMRCLSAMLSWSVPRAYRKDNPCREIKRLPIGDGYEPWPWEIVDRAWNELRRDLLFASVLALYTGQRQSDVLAMRRNAIQGDLINVVQEKTGKELLIPIHRDLRPFLASMDHSALTLCTTLSGKPWKRAKDGRFSGFKSAWRDHAPRFLKDGGYVFHGLRKTAVVTLLEVGCTDAEVSAITGQSRRMIVHYAKRVAQEKLARAAMGKWERD